MSGDAEVPFRVVIPARLGSTRLPRKVLAPIHGRPLVAWTWQAAVDSGAESVVIATDNQDVAAACTAFGADVEMTSPDIRSGTDRVQAVVVARRWPSDTLVVNVQGDEPEMPPALVRQAASLLAAEPDAGIATLCHPLDDASAWRDPNVVKVVRDTRGHALYFSRAPVPWPRDAAGAAPPAPLRHIGIYAYRAAALARFSGWAPSPLEQVESLEQLRALENGMVIAVGVVDGAPPRGVDTEADLEAVRRRIPSPTA